MAGKLRGRGGYSVAEQKKEPKEEEVLGSEEQMAADVAAIVDHHFHCSYVDEAPDELTCPICTEPAIEPLDLCDEHLICSACVPVIGKRLTCPVCDERLPTDEDGKRALPATGRRIQRMLEKLSVMCPLEDCAWTGPRGNLRDHMRLSCEHVPCRLVANGCAFTGSVTAVIRHLDRDCGEVLVQCPSPGKECQQNVARKALHEHLTPENCPAIRQEVEERMRREAKEAARAEEERLKAEAKAERERAETEARLQRERAAAAAKAEADRLRAREAMVRMAVSTMVNTDVVTLLVEDRRFTVSRNHLLDDQCRGSVLEVLGKMKQQDHRIDCGVREFVPVMSWVRYGLVPMQASMNESEWAELLALTAALCLDTLERALRTPSRAAVTSLASARGTAVNLRGYDLSGIELTCSLRHADFSGSNLSGSVLSASLRHAIFCGCDLSGADLSGSDLKMADFSESNLNGSTFRHAIEGVCFRSCDLRNADLSQVPSIVGADFTGAMLEGCLLPPVMKGCDFSGCDLSQRQFNDGDLQRCDFSSTVMEGTSFKKCNLAQALFGALKKVSLEACEMKECDFTSAVQEATRFVWCKMPDARAFGELTNVTFVACALQGCDFSSAVVKNTVFKKCKLLNALVAGDLTKATFTDCNLTTTALIGSDARGVDFSTCVLDGADFSRAFLDGTVLPDSLRATVFEGASLVGTNFDRKSCLEAVFSGANLRDASFAHCKLASANFNNCDLSGANLTLASLQGATLSGANLADTCLDGAVFDNASMQRANFANAILSSRTSFARADLSGASLRTDITQALWSHTKLGNVQVDLERVPMHLRYLFCTR